MNNNVGAKDSSENSPVTEVPSSTKGAGNDLERDDTHNIPTQATTAMTAEKIEPPNNDIPAIATATGPSSIPEMDATANNIDAMESGQVGDATASTTSMNADRGVSINNGGATNTDPNPPVPLEQPTHTEVLTEEPMPVVPRSTSKGNAVISSSDRTWGMIAHLSVFSGFIIPFGHILGPILVLVFKAGQGENIIMPFVAQHTKESLNFQIAVTVYTLICFLLAVVVIGALLLPVLFVSEIVLVIVAAIEANKGDEYKYPWIFRCIK